MLVDYIGVRVSTVDAWVVELFRLRVGTVAFLHMFLTLKLRSLLESPVLDSAPQILGFLAHPAVVQ
jgi:hypothetical protein